MDLSVIITNNKKKIAFYTPQIDVRGTCVAIYDYANYNEQILGNKSLIIAYKNPNNDFRNDIEAIVKFEKRFEVFYFTSMDKVKDKLKNEQYDAVYNIKYGKTDGQNFGDNIKHLNHAVFDCSEPHGDVFAAVSQTLASKFNYHLYVPHMIALQKQTDENMRSLLKIPENAVVFGRYGGLDTFNLQYTNDVIRCIVDKDPLKYFLFANTPFFYSHPQIIYVDKFADDITKNRFINTCDAFLESNNLGHTFGLAIGEFSFFNKPIICNNDRVWNRTHLDILQDKAITYKDSYTLSNILSTFDPLKYENKDNNAYKEYTPEKVMAIFYDVFLRQL